MFDCIIVFVLSILCLIVRMTMMVMMATMVKEECN